MPFPDYSGGGLVNLVAELERRLAGSGPMPGLTTPEHLPEAAGYVLVILDGVGSHQLVGRPLGGFEAATLTVGFSTTTTTSLATVATGLAPAGHGVIGHLIHLPGVADVVNALKWVTPEGNPVAHDYGSVLPSPNLWERLAAAGVEPITVQPGAFSRTPLSRMLYRGCRFEAAWTVDELAAATLDLAGPRRLVVTYFPSVDVAAHVHGQESEQYGEAMRQAQALWDRLAVELPAEVVLAGTSDHGHVDYREGDKVLVRDRRYDSLRFYGDSRATYVSGDAPLIAALAEETGCRLVERPQMRPWLGPGPAHPELERRLPDAVLLSPPGRLLLPRGFDKRLIGYHGGLEPEELVVPLLVR